MRWDSGRAAPRRLKKPVLAPNCAGASGRFGGAQPGRHAWAGPRHRGRTRTGLCRAVRRSACSAHRRTPPRRSRWRSTASRHRWSGALAGAVDGLRRHRARRRAEAARRRHARAPRGGARDDEIVKIIDHFKPGVPGDRRPAAGCPGAPAARGDARRRARGLPAWAMPLKLRSSIGGRRAVAAPARFWRSVCAATAIASRSNRRPSRAGSQRSKASASTRRWAGDCPLGGSSKATAHQRTRASATCCIVVEQLACARAPRPSAPRRSAPRARRRWPTRPARRSTARSSRMARRRAAGRAAAALLPAPTRHARPGITPRPDDAAATAARRHEDECTISTHHRAPRPPHAAALLLTGSAFAQQAQEEPFCGPAQDRHRDEDGAGARLPDRDAGRQAAGRQDEAAAGLQGRGLGQRRSRRARPAPGRQGHGIRVLAVRGRQDLRRGRRAASARSRPSPRSCSCPTASSSTRARCTWPRPRTSRATTTSRTASMRRPRR